MKVISVLLCLVMSLFLSPIHAQSWPSIPPTEVFHSSIEVQSIEPAQAPEVQNWDNDFRIFVIDGNIFPYQDDFHNLYGIDELDKKYLLLTVGFERPGSEYDKLETWIFERSTQTLAPFNDQCSPKGASSGEEIRDTLWTISREGDNHYLCNRLTGAKSQALPTDHNWIFETSRDYEPITSVSPDQRYAAFLGMVGTEVQPVFYGETEVYSYDTISGKILSLGTLGAESYIYFDEWFGNQVTLEAGGTTNISSHSVYIADVTQTGSLEMALSSSGWSPMFLDNPPRYVIGYDNLYSQSPCGKETFYVETRQYVRLDLDGLCHPEFGDIEGIGYYRDVPFGESHECCVPVPANVAEVPLVRYDTRTGERQELYRGEIEKILWVSPDEHYALLVIDNNGRIDLFPYLRGYEDNQALGFPWVKLVDLQTGKPIAGATADYLMEDYPRLPITENPIVPLADGSFIVVTCLSEACGFFKNSAVHFTITDTGIQESHTVDRAIMLTPDKTGVLAWSHPFDATRPNAPSQQAVNIYDLATGTTQPLIQELDWQYHNLNMSILDEHRLKIEISRHQTDGREEASATYIVYFEPGSSPYVGIEKPAYSPIGEYVCVLRTETGVNLRVGPGGNLERFGTAEQGEKLLADGQAVSSNDGLIWWRLKAGGWVRSDFVTASPACAALPDVSQETPNSITPEATAEVNAATTTPEATANADIVLLNDL